MPKLKNSNETFWVIFKHCAFGVCGLNTGCCGYFSTRQIVWSGDQWGSPDYQIGHSHVGRTVLVAKSLPFRKFRNIVQPQFVTLMSVKYFFILAFFINFWPFNLLIDLSGNTVWPFGPVGPKSDFVKNSPNWLFWPINWWSKVLPDWSVSYKTKVHKKYF